MNSSLLNRSLGALRPEVFARDQTTRLLYALQPVNDTFNGRGSSAIIAKTGQHEKTLAHPAGVNTITIDVFEGRFLLSGGADGSVTRWDLNAQTSSTDRLHRPVSIAKKSPATHNFGLTHLSFYPTDSGAFLSSSYDHTLKLWSSETMSPHSSWDLDSVVYSVAMSSLSSSPTVACATQHPAVRLVDLRTKDALHALAGHGGAVMAVAWSPVDEHILASGGQDGTVRFWDTRKSSPMLGALDLEDSVGVLGYNGMGAGARRRERGHAHIGPVNGVVWTEDGRHMVTTGHDEKIRVWDLIKGANTLANFGPLIRNKHMSPRVPCLVPGNMVNAGKETVFYPSEGEIMMFELFEGRLVKRLKAHLMPDPPFGINSSEIRGQRNLKSRSTSLAWRAHHVELYSAHGDGSIRAWRPRTVEDAMADEEWENDQEEREKDIRGKRQLLDDIERAIKRQRVAPS